MVRRGRRAAVAGLLLFSAVGSAAGDGIGLDADLTYGYARDLSASMQGELEAIPSFGFALSGAASLSVSARVRLDAFDDLEPGAPALDTYAGASRPVRLGEAGTAEIRDLYVEVRSGRGLTRLGRQQIVWGRLDGLKVLDVVNPQEFREFVLDDFSRSRIGLWSAYFDYSVGNWRAEAALIPDGTGHAIPEAGAYFELTAPRFRYGASFGEDTLPVTTVRPGHSPGESAAGLRLSRQAGTAEIGFLAYTGMDPEPLGRVVATEGTPVLERYYERRDVVGLSIDAALGSVVFRAEYAFQPGRVFNDRSPAGLEAVGLDQHRGAVGLDFDAPMGMFVNVQYLVDTIRDAPGTLVRPARDRVGTLFVRRAFGYDRLVLEGRWYYSFSDGDNLVRLAADYALSDKAGIRLGAEWFTGVNDGLFGQFSGRDRITLGIRQTF